MGTELEYSSIRDDEIDAAVRINSVSYGMTEEYVRTWFERAGTVDLRVARRGGAPVATVRLIRMGQFWGGRSVPMTGIAGVATAPEARGSGVARWMVDRALEEIHGSGAPLSTLFPATVALYRRSGYELAGRTVVARIPITNLPRGDRSLSIRAVTGDDHELIGKLYGRYALRINGHLDRGPYIWDRMLRFKDAPVEGIIVSDGAGEACGYVLYRTEQIDASFPGQRVIVHDMAFRDAPAAKRLLSFLADFSSVAREAELRVGPTHPVLLLVRDNRWSFIHREFWMARIVDVRGAFAARGYPPAVSAGLSINVRDELFDANDGRFMIHVADGRGLAEPGGDGGLAMDIQTLACLYAGFMSPWELRAAGRLDGPDEDLARAEAVFGGPGAWMPEMF